MNVPLPAVHTSSPRLCATGFLPGPPDLAGDLGPALHPKRAPHPCASAPFCRVSRAGFSCTSAPACHVPLGPSVSSVTAATAAWQAPSCDPDAGAPSTVWVTRREQEVGDGSVTLGLCQLSRGRSPVVSEQSRDESNSAGKSNKHRPYSVQTRTNSHCHVTGQTVTVGFALCPSLQRGCDGYVLSHTRQSQMPWALPVGIYHRPSPYRRWG